MGKRKGGHTLSKVALGIASIFALYLIFVQYSSGFTCSAGCYNVVSYGASPNTPADSTNAIYLAITAAKNAGGGTIYFPSGTYSISSAILNTTNYGSNIKLQGAPSVLVLASQNSKQICNQITNTATCRTGIINVEGVGTPFRNFAIDSLVFDGNKQQQDPSPMQSGILACKCRMALLRMWQDHSLASLVGPVTITNSIFRNGIAAGAEFEGIDGVTLNKVQAINNGFLNSINGKLTGAGGGDGIYITGSNEVLSYVTATDNSDTDISFEGMESYIPGPGGSPLGQIDHCIVGGNSQTGIALANNPYDTTQGRVAVHDTKVFACTVNMINRNFAQWNEGTRGMQLDNYGGIGFPQNIEIYGNDLSTNDWFSLVVKGTNINVHDNILENSKTVGMILSDGSGYAVANNSFNNEPVGIQKAGQAVGITITNPRFSAVTTMYSGLVGAPSCTINGTPC